MGVEVTLLDVSGHSVRGLPDPSGGTFDAAGDFDRLLESSDHPSFSEIDPYGETILGPERLLDVIEAIRQQLALTLSGPERRGLLRFETLAVMARDRGGSVKLAGD